MNNEIKKCFPGMKFNHYKEFFYHVNADEYDIKIMTSDRSYLLYKMFTEIVSSDTKENSVVYNDNIREKCGLVLNLHSTSYIEHFLKNYNSVEGKKLKVLLVEDSIDGDKKISKQYDIVKNLLDKYKANYDLKIWCLDINKENQINQIPNDRITTYMPADKLVTQFDTTNFTSAIIKWNKGFNSYLRTYESEKNIDELVKLISANLNYKVEEFKDNIKGQITRYHCLFGDTKSNSFTPIIRMYNKVGASGTIIIPFVYINDLNRNSIMKIYDELNSEYNIGSIPSCFNDIENNQYALEYFYKWLTYVSSSKLIERISNSINEKIKLVFDCKESFYGIDDNQYNNYNAKNKNLINSNDNISIKETVLDVSEFDYSTTEGIYNNILELLIRSYTQEKDEDFSIHISDIMQDDEEKNRKILTAVFNIMDKGGAISNINYNDKGMLDISLSYGDQTIKSFYDIYAKQHVILQTLIFNLLIDVSSRSEVYSIVEEFTSYSGINKRYSLEKYLDRLSEIGISDTIFYDTLNGLDGYYRELLKNNNEDYRGLLKNNSEDLINAYFDARDFAHEKHAQLYLKNKQKIKR